MQVKHIAILTNALADQGYTSRAWKSEVRSSHLREDVIVLEALRKDPPNLLAMWVPDAMDPAGWTALVAHEGDEEVVDMAEEAAAMATTVYFSLKVKK